MPLKAGEERSYLLHTPQLGHRVVNPAVLQLKKLRELGLIELPHTGPDILPEDEVEEDLLFPCIA